MLPATAASAYRDSLLRKNRAETRANLSGGVTRLNPAQNPGELERLQAIKREHQKLLLARLEGRTAGALVGLPANEGSLYLDREDVATLQPSFTGSALFDKLVREFVDDTVPGQRLTPGAGEAESEAPVRAAPDPRLVLGAFAGAALLIWFLR